MASLLFAIPFWASVVVVGLICLAATTLTIQALYRVVAEKTSNPYKHIPAARHEGSWLSTLFLGDFESIKAADPVQQHVNWMRQMGPVYRYRHMFHVQRLFLADSRAMMHILNNSANYPKPDHTSTFLRAVLGNGLVTIEGHDHRRQRKIITPALSPKAVANLQPVIEKHAFSLVEKLASLVTASSQREKTAAARKKDLQPGEVLQDRQVALPREASSRGDTCVVDVLHWLSRSSLDIIGEAAFDYQFNALETRHEESEMLSAIENLIATIMDVNLGQAIAILLSEIRGLGFLRSLPTKRNRAMWNSQRILHEQAVKIVQDAKFDLEKEAKAVGLLKEKSISLSANMLEEFEESGPSFKALMWRLIKANMAEDLKEKDRMSDDELVNQIMTFLFAGHETTATQTSWALYALAGDLSVQEKLRQELKGVYHPSQPHHEGLSELPYLDAVTREVIRLYPSVVSTVRTVKADDVVPLSHPYPTADGKSTYSHVVLPKDHELFIPMGAVQQNEEIWGPDASEFKPDRWFNLPQTVTDARLPGHTLAFLAGARSCVGQRLAILEVKSLLAHLVLCFEFRRVDEYVLHQKQMVVRRAIVKGQEAHGTRLPLVVTRLPCSS